MESNNSHTPDVTSLTSLRHVSTYRAGVAQSAAYRLLRQYVDDCVDSYDLTTMQWFMLGVVYDAGETGITVTELSQALDTTIPYITTTLNMLERGGMVKRTPKPGDGRTRVVRLVPRHIKTVEKIEHDLRCRMRDTIYKDISPQELRVYLTVVYKLISALEPRAKL